MPLPENRFKRHLDRPAPMPGVWSMSGSPMAAEALGLVGYDFVVLDMEHAPTDVPRLLASLQAVAATSTPAVVRLPWNEPVVVKQVLDLGAQTVMFPYVQTAEEAHRAVASTRYPPAGMRGVAGMSRATRFGGVLPEYFRRAAEEICDHPEVREAIAAAAARCRQSGKPGGILAADVTRAGEYLDMGFTWVATGSDLGLMVAGARSSLAALRDRGA